MKVETRLLSSVILTLGEEAYHLGTTVTWVGHVRCSRWWPREQRCSGSGVPPVDREGALESALVYRLFLSLSLTHTLGLLLWSCTVVLSVQRLLKNTLSSALSARLRRRRPPFACLGVRQAAAGLFCMQRLDGAAGRRERLRECHYATTTARFCFCCLRVYSLLPIPHSGAGVLVSLPLYTQTFSPFSS